ncbi:MAG TPA: hypothetical protein VG326_00825 [Tepidisphaeraceae bacterium]|nr:hypothetical protein [Tepidisphaeraceae bacterium]
MGKTLALAAATAVLAFVPAMARAQEDYTPSADALSLSPAADRVASDATKAPGEAEELPRYFDAAPPAVEQPNIHGFFSSPFKTAYVTPRGLVVQDKGLVWQPIVGLVFPLGDFGPLKNVAFVGGIWNSVDTYEASANPSTGPWDEMDTFASFSGTVAGAVSLNLTYGEWNSPEHAFVVEHNLDLKISYDDSKMWGSTGFALNPYVDCWWAISGSSTVILGRHGGTGYFEPGISPTFSIKAVPDYPLTITVPMYFSIGDAGYWDATRTYTSSIFGLASISVNLSVPLSFIPTRYGHWHADAGVTYDYLINDSLLHAGELASGNNNHNVVIGSLGFGVNF